MWISIVEISHLTNGKRNADLRYIHRMSLRQKIRKLQRIKIMRILYTAFVHVNFSPECFFWDSWKFISSCRGNLPLRDATRKWWVSRPIGEVQACSCSSFFLGDAARMWKVLKNRYIFHLHLWLLTIRLLRFVEGFSLYKELFFWCLRFKINGKNLTSFFLFHA